MLSCNIQWIQYIYITMWILFFVIHIIFILYFFAIWVWRLALLPLIILVALLFNSQSSTTEVIAKKSTITLDSFHEFITQHALVIAWSLIVLWWWWLVDIYANLWSEQLFWLLWIHIILRWWSYIYDFEDWKKIFHVWYYVTLLLLFIQIFKSVSVYDFFHYIMAFLVMTMAIYGSIVFLMTAMDKKVDNITKYMYFILFNVSVIILIYLWGRDDLHSAIVLAQVYLMALYVVIYWVRWWYNQIRDDVTIDETYLAEEILDWKRILWRKLPFADEAVLVMNNFLDNLDQKTTFSLSFLNIILVAIQVYLFVVSFWVTDGWLVQFVFWFWLAAFFVNYLLLREIWFYHELQRAVAFILLNFGIYISIIHAFWNNIFGIVVLGVLWSILNSLLMFLGKKLNLHALLSRQDYYYWIWTTMLSTLVNMYFILRLPLSWQFRFSVMFIYLWLQCVLLLYALRHILQKRLPMTIEQQVEQMIKEW